MQQLNFSKQENQGSSFTEEIWDKKRIVLVSGIGILIVAGVIFTKTYILGEQKEQVVLEENSFQPVRNVAGTSIKKETISPTPTIGIEEKVRDSVAQNIESLKQQVTNLNPADVAASSPQVQKILNDIKTAQEYPKTQAKEICESICKGL